MAEPQAAGAALAPTWLQGCGCSQALPTVWWERPGEAALETPPPGWRGLRLMNTFTRTKTPFVPLSGNRVGWYICGPTVYDSAHLGHARNYMGFDILRRVLTDYFGCDERRRWCSSLHLVVAEALP